MSPALGAGTHTSLLLIRKTSRWRHPSETAASRTGWWFETTPPPRPRSQQASRTEHRPTRRIRAAKLSAWVQAGFCADFAPQDPRRRIAQSREKRHRLQSGHREPHPPARTCRRHVPPARSDPARPPCHSNSAVSTELPWPPDARQRPAASLFRRVRMATPLFLILHPPLFLKLYPTLFLKLYPTLYPALYPTLSPAKFP